MNQRKFKTSSIKRIVIYIFSFIAVFIFTSFFLTDTYKIFYWLINIAVFALCFLLIFFENDITIICDEVGCTVTEKRFWQNSGKSYNFKWNEVSETEYFADSETSREFYVEIDGIKRKILTADFSFDDVDYFIETVNQATPHLPYFWEKNDGLIGSAFEGRRFSKTAR